MLRTIKRTYLQLRGHVPGDCVARAIRFIYLNKTAFNGIYRVNRQGAFNVPFAGIQGRSVCDEEGLRNASAALQHSEILVRGFDPVAEAQKGDLMYCDPPYTVLHNNNGFIRDNESLFSWDEQRKLASTVRDAVARGVFAVVSNADHDSLRRLYKGFAVKKLCRVSCMAGDSARRGQTSECLFVGDRSRI